VSVDYRSLAVFTTRTFHHSGCDHLKLAESPKTQPAWLSFYLITPPCRTCFISTDFNDWLHQLRLFHQDCAPNMPITPEIEMVQPKPTIGRPRSLSREDLERVLSLSKAGLGSRSITRELQKAGVDVSRPTIQRALAKRGVYANKMASVTKFPQLESERC